MARMTGGGALVEMLRRHDVDTIFALPGVQNDALFVAFYDAGEALRVIHTRHEQGAAYMAFGYARASGKVGAYAVVPGPGMLNTTAALATAYATNAPVLCISGQVASDLIGRGFGLLHEIPDQLRHPGTADQMGGAHRPPDPDRKARQRGVPPVARRPPAPGLPFAKASSSLILPFLKYMRVGMRVSPFCWVLPMSLRISSL